MAEHNIIPKDVIDTSTSKATTNWHELLQLQTQMFLPHEVSFFLGCKDWLDAKSVLDVGCGNGSYIKKIADHFPEKRYIGIDISPELISIAKQENYEQNILFEQGDFYQFENDEKFDVIIMRLIVQHLKGFNPILLQAAKLLKPGGSLVIVEPDLENSWNRPATVKFERLLNGINENSQQQQTNRCILSELDNMISTSVDWYTERKSTVSIPYIAPLDDSKLLRLYNLWIDILDDSQVVSLPFREVRNELEAWSKRADTYAQIGIIFLHIKFKGK